MKTTKGKYEYEIDKNNVVRVWDTESEHEAPLYLQDVNPDGNVPWKNAAEATAWVEEHLDARIASNEEALAPTE